MLRPVVKFLETELIERIIAEARDVLCKLGVTVHNDDLLSLLADHGADVDKNNRHVKFTEDIIDRAIKSAPSGFRLYDALGEQRCDLSGDNVHFTPGSAAIYFLDADQHDTRKATAADYVKYSILVSRMEYIASQSTAMVPSDVPGKISDSMRLYLSLMMCEKPVVTGAFTIESFEVMKDLQGAVRGSVDELRKKPLTIFSCCPTSPLKWSDVTSQNLVDCASYGIPVEYVAMPLAGFIAPVTLVGTLIQHTAETLSGLVLTQLSYPGAPVLYGGSPAIFDIRYETPPMGAIETEMIDCAYSEIGKYLGLPTQAYIGLSDAKHLDAQAGLETSMGATLAALSGINSVSGPGMLDFEMCQSMEKVLLDHDVCGMALRLVGGIQKREGDSVALLNALVGMSSFLGHDHTRQNWRKELFRPSNLIDRDTYLDWEGLGARWAHQRAADEVPRRLARHQPEPLSDTLRGELERIMLAELGRFGVDALPA